MGYALMSVSPAFVALNKFNRQGRTYKQSISLVMNLQHLEKSSSLRSEKKVLTSFGEKEEHGLLSTNNYQNGVVMPSCLSSGLVETKTGINACASGKPSVAI